MKKVLNGRYTPFALAGAILFGILLLRISVEFFQAVGAITIIVSVILIVLYFQRSRWKLAKAIGSGREIQLQTPIIGEDLLNYLDRGNFEYPGLQDIKLDRDGNVIVRVGRKKATIKVQPESLGIQSNMGADEEYLLMTSMKAFLYPSENIDVESLRRQVQWPKKIKPYLYGALVLLLAFFLLTDSSMQYRINGLVSSKGIYSMKLEAYPRKTFGEFMGDFLSQPRWSNYTSEGQQYVNLSGVCAIGGIEAQVVFTFAPLENSARLDDCKVNGESVGTLMGWLIIDAAYQQTAVTTLAASSSQPNAATDNNTHGSEPAIEYGNSEALEDFQATLSSFAGRGVYTNFGNIGGEDYWTWFDGAYDYYGTENLYHIWFFDNAEIGIEVYEGLMYTDSDAGWPAGTDTWNLYYVIDHASDPTYGKRWSASRQDDTVVIDLQTKLYDSTIRLDIKFVADIATNTFYVAECWADDLNGSGAIAMSESEIDGLLNYLAENWQMSPGINMYVPDYVVEG